MRSAPLAQSCFTGILSPVPVATSAKSGYASNHYGISPGSFFAKSFRNLHGRRR
jgi:hypothetical protein